MHEFKKINTWTRLEEYKKSRESSFNPQSKDTHTRSITNSIVSAGSITLDFSKQLIDNHVLELLLELAQECDLKKSITQLMSGHPINLSEGRPALHTALRATNSESIIVNETNIIPEVKKTRKKMGEIAMAIRDSEWLGYSGKPIRNIVNIGIGGSYLGAYFCTQALADFVQDGLGIYFLTSIDSNEFKRVINKLEPETTLFIVASKTFTTKETMYNMQQAMQWLNQPQHIAKHFIAVTANEIEAQRLGLIHILPIWDWVGGRYSPCSAINLITCIALGDDRFSEMLAGAAGIDEHFRTAEYSQNLPVLLALLGIWNNNFLNINNLLLLVYSYDLQQFVPYLQQLDMESNGKLINQSGDLVDYATGPIIWGGLAQQAQHSYFQLLCQGSHSVAADLLRVHSDDTPYINQIYNGHWGALATARANQNNLSLFKSSTIPTNCISLDNCTPKSIGALMALYEHKVFVQSVVWNINAFDQPGVELAKRLIK